MSLLEKLKNLFTSNGLSVSTKKQSVLPACIRLNEEPELYWNVAEQIGDGAFGKIFKFRYSRVAKRLYSVSDLPDVATSCLYIYQATSQTASLHRTCYFGRSVNSNNSALKISMQTKSFICNKNYSGPKAETFATAVNKTSGVEAALKRVLIDNAAEIADYVIEIEILSICEHPNIIHLLDSYYYGNQISIYLEYCFGGAVDAVMHELERPLSELQISCVTLQLCEALDYVHKRGIIHRDLKAGNVLLTGDGVAKLADFGVSALEKTVGQKHNTFIGTPFWMAPEVIACETDKNNFYDCKADIWSLGVTLIEFAQIDPPNHSMNPSRVMMKIRLGEPPCLSSPKKWSDEFNEIIRQCLQKEPTSRPTASQLLKHPFLVSTSSSNTQSLVELVMEVKAEVTIQVTDIDSVDLMNATCYDTQSSDGFVFDEMISSEQEITDTLAMSADETINKPMETVELPRSVTTAVSDANSDNKMNTASPINVTNRQEREVQVLNLKFGDYGENIGRGSETSYIFAASRFPIVRHDTYTDDVIRESPAPVVSDVDSNFSRQKVRYQSLTKTRRYVYEGKVVTRRTSKVIVSGMENVEQEERDMRKAELRALQLLQRAENRQREEFDERMSLQRHQLERQLELRRQEFLKSYSTQLEVLDREYRQKIKKLEAVFSRHLQEVTEHLKLQQERDLKMYRQEMKQRQLSDEARLKGNHKEVLWNSLEQLESEYAAKEKKFIEQQEAFYQRKLRHCMAEHRSQLVSKESSLLNEKQKLLRCREAAVWEVEECYLLESGALKKQQIQQLYELLRRQLAFRRTQELELVGRANERSMAALQRRLAADSKQLTKRLKKESRSRRLTFCNDLEQRRSIATSDQEREAIKHFDEMEKLRMKKALQDADVQRNNRLQRMRDRNAAALNDLDQQFLVRQQTMIEKESALLKEEEAKQQDNLRSFRDSLVLRKQQLESKLLQQRSSLDLSSIQLVDANDKKYQQAVKSELERSIPGDVNTIFGDQTSTVF